MSINRKRVETFVYIASGIITGLLIDQLIFQILGSK